MRPFFLLSSFHISANFISVFIDIVLDICAVYLYYVNILIYIHNSTHTIYYIEGKILLVIK